MPTLHTISVDYCYDVLLSNMCTRAPTWTAKLHQFLTSEMIIPSIFLLTVKEDGGVSIFGHLIRSPSHGIYLLLNWSNSKWFSGLFSEYVDETYMNSSKTKFHFFLVLHYLGYPRGYKVWLIQVQLWSWNDNILLERSKAYRCVKT